MTRRLTNICALGALLAAGLFGSTSARVGLEDIFGSQAQGSDLDFNDMILGTIGLDHHWTAEFLFDAPPWYNEIPFPDGHYFDFATVEDGKVWVGVLSAQSAYPDVAMMKIGDGGWFDIPDYYTQAQGLDLTAPIGTQVWFAIRGPETFYSDPALNSDARFHAAVFVDAPAEVAAETPEAGGLASAAGGLLLIGVSQFRKRASRKLRTAPTAIDSSELYARNKLRETAA